MAVHLELVIWRRTVDDVSLVSLTFEDTCFTHLGTDSSSVVTRRNCVCVLVRTCFATPLRNG